MAWRFAGGRLFARARQGLPLAAACGCVLSDRLKSPLADCWSFGQSPEAKRESELEQALSKAQLAAGKELGEGSFATVRLVKRNTTGAQYALKLVDKDHTSPAVMEKELKVLRTIGQHRHVVSMVEELETPGAWGILLDLVTGGEVFDRICEDGAFSEQDAAQLVRQVAEALQHVHGAGVCHRDLKPENLLLCSHKHDADVKVCDFGIADFYEAGMEGKSGTVAYMAPEQLQDGKYGPEVDLWAVGVILYILLSGYHPFDPEGASPERAHRRTRRRGVFASWACRDPWQYGSVVAVWQHGGGMADKVFGRSIWPTCGSRLASMACPPTECGAPN